MARLNKKIESELLSIKLTLHELSTRLNNLETDSHPPVFKVEEFDARLQVLEAFFNNIKRITTDYEEN